MQERGDTIPVNLRLEAQNQIQALRDAPVSSDLSLVSKAIDELQRTPCSSSARKPPANPQPGSPLMQCVQW